MKVIVTGDFAPINRAEELINKGDFETLYGNVLTVLKSADLSITNLEAPITDSAHKIDKTGPILKVKENCVEAIKQGGFSLVTLANNHIGDYGEQGIKDTIESLINNDVGLVGAGANNFEARKPYIFEKEGKRIAILSIAENEWSTTTGDNYGANPLNEIDNYYDISEATKIADYVLVIIHGGHEMYNLPSPRMQKLYRFFIDAGADAVVGHHTHCYSGYEYYKEKPIVYSLGNFVFDKNNNHTTTWNSGILVELYFTSTGVEIKIIPYYQFDAKSGLRLMDKEEMEKFENDIKDLNCTISNSEKLEQSFDVYCRKSDGMYTAYIQPYRNKYLHALRKRGLIKNVWSARKRLLLTNLVRCEAHRDVLLNILKK